MGMTTNVIGAAGMALTAMGLITTSAVPAAVVGTASVAANTYAWADSASCDNTNENLNDWLRVIKLNNDANIEFKPEQWGTSASLINGAEGYTSEHGGVGWIDMTSGKNYWHPSDSFQPKQAKLVWVQDKNASATAFPKTKLKTK